jgi:hypothetical protein
VAHSTLARPEADLSAVLSSFIDRILNKPVLGTCCYVRSVVSRDATGQDAEVFTCGDPAIVHDLASDEEYCAAHFRAVSILRALEAVSRG